MRSVLLTVCLLGAGICIHALTRIERPASIAKRAASPQFYQPPNNTYGSNNQTRQFQWAKVNNQWVRSDGKSLPGYSAANVPYNQTGNQWRTPSPTQPGAAGFNRQPSQQAPQQPVQPRPQTPTPARRQDSTQLNWNPNADRALTQDTPHTTPRPAVIATTPTPARPLTPTPVYKPAPVTPPSNRPFGSGIPSQQRPQTRPGGWNPDASLTYDVPNNPPPRNNPPPKPTPSRSGSNPWAGIF